MIEHTQWYIKIRDCKLRTVTLYLHLPKTCRRALRFTSHHDLKHLFAHSAHVCAQIGVYSYVHACTWGRCSLCVTERFQMEMEIKSVNVASSPAAEGAKSTNDFSRLMNSCIWAFLHAAAKPFRLTHTCLYLSMQFLSFCRSTKKKRSQQGMAPFLFLAQINAAALRFNYVCSGF